MKTVLIINSSARMRISLSRKLTEAFVGHWKSIHPNPTIRFRELGNTDVPHVNENWIAAAFKPEAARSDDEIEALKISDAYISELREADVIVLGAPMYNWSVPSALKAYLDQVLRVNETFTIDPARVQDPYVGLLKNKTLFLLLSRGEQGYEKGGYNEHLDFQSTYLKTVFTIMGIRRIHVITLSGKSPDLKQSIDTSNESISALIEMELVLHP
jgi:FMN-dependent NADH-azoreductase